MDKKPKPRILTNMTFWQSSEWVEQVNSIYPEHGENTETPHSPFKEAWLMFKQRKSYDIIHTMGIRESMIYGLLCLLTRKPSKQVMTEIFVDEETNTLTWKLKTALYKKIAQRSLGIITNSKAEIPDLAKRLALPEERFRYVPLNSTIEPTDEPLPGEGFILSAGRSLRDYQTLIKAAPSINAPIIIIGGNDDLQNTTLPPNVTLLREVDRATYLDHVRRCTIMVLPLQETTRPTGQVVLLEAMSYGKPVIATEQAGTIDYIDNGSTGILIPHHDAKTLVSAITRLLQDTNKARKIGRSALKSIHSNHTHTAHTAYRLSAIRIPTKKYVDNTA